MGHVQNAIQSLAGTETAAQVDFVSRYEMLSAPSVVALGALGMFHWDATAVLPRIHVPVLLIAGDRDATTFRRQAGHMQKENRHASLVEAGTAHGCH
jgi:pimeloyl-ACP methyl ester carboxylesterase